ncbi:hypothetical protein [Rhizobium phage RHEph24]|nr:hypothetical protein [Rhizobium phage RHEph24]
MHYIRFVLPRNRMKDIVTFLLLVPALTYVGWSYVSQHVPEPTKKVKDFYYATKAR